MIHRRSLLLGLVAAPAIVKINSLMALRGVSLITPRPFSSEFIGLMGDPGDVGLLGPLGELIISHAVIYDTILGKIIWSGEVDVKFPELGPWDIT